MSCSRVNSLYKCGRCDGCRGCSGRDRCLLAIVVTLLVALVALASLVLFPNRANAETISKDATSKAYMLVYTGNNGGVTGGRYLYIEDEGALPDGYEYDTWAGEGGFIGRVVSAKTNDAWQNDGRLGDFVCPLYEVSRSDYDIRPGARSLLLYTPGWGEVVSLCVDVNLDPNMVGYVGTIFNNPYHLGGDNGMGTYTKSQYYSGVRYEEYSKYGIKAYIDRDEGSRFSLIRYYACDSSDPADEGYGPHAWSAVNETVPNYRTDTRFTWSFEGRTGFPLFNFFNVAYDKNSDAATGTMATQTDLKFGYMYGSSSDANYNKRYLVANCGFSRPGYTFDGYTLSGARSGNGTKFNAGDRITAGRSNNSENTVDVDIDRTITMKAQWKANNYRVEFDGNKPADAEHNVSGSTAGFDAFYDTPFTMPSSGYSLRGWKFSGWNTKPDGTGTSYSPGASVSNLTTVSGATVKLYARWTRNMGGASLTKIDADSSSITPSGDATLAGAKVEIVSACTHDITVAGKTVHPGGVAATLTTNANGVATTASKLLPSGFYKVRESVPSSGYRLNSSWGGRFEVVSDGVIVSLDSVIGRLPETVVRGSVSVKLHDADGMPKAQGDATFEGAKFNVVNKSTKAVKVGGHMVAPGGVVATLTTDANGNASTAARSLPYGTYEIVPVSPSRGYAFSSPKATVSVRSEGATVNADFNESVVRGNVSAQLHDADGMSKAQGDATFAGATLDVVNKSAASIKVGDRTVAPGEVALTITTDGNGHTSTDTRALPYGTYDVVPVSPSRGYEYASSKSTVSVRSDGANSNTDFNESVIRGGVSAKLHDADGMPGAQGDATFAGATLDVVNKSDAAVKVGNRTFAPGDVILTLTTDDNGNASTDAKALPYGTYDVVPVSPSRGYKHSSPKSTVSVRDKGANVNSDFDESVIRGSVSVQLHDAEGMTNAQGDATFAGATLDVVNKSAVSVKVGDRTVAPGEVALTLTTDANGNASTDAKALPYGTYDVVPVSPSRGYEYASPKTTVSVRSDGSNLGTDFDESVIRGSASSQLHDAEGMDLAQADATFAGATLDVVNKSAAPVKVNGRTVEPGDVALTLTTDDNGSAATAARALPYGTYDVVPASPSRGYEYSSPKSTVSVREKDSNLGTDFNELLIRSSLRAEKVDSVTGRTVQGDATFEGCTFGIRVESAHPFKVHGVDGTDHVYQSGDVIPSSVTGLVTGPDGIASCGALLPWADASLVVVEESAPVGYLKGDDAARITANGGNARVVGYDVTHVPSGTSLSADVATISDYVSGTNGTFVSCTKFDAETSVAQGDGSRAGCVLAVTNSSRSIVHVTFDEDGNPHSGRDVAPGGLVCRIVTNEDGYARTGTLPYGTYDVREVKPPVGMHLDADWEARLVAHDDGVEFPCSVHNKSFRSGVAVRKIDSSFWGDVSGGLPEHTLDLGQGDATFAGAVFEVYNVGRAPVFVDGRMVRPATHVAFDETLAKAGASKFLSEVSPSEWIPVGSDVALTLTCDANGRCASAANALPYGTYVIREVKAPQGYVLNPDWGRGTVFAVRDEGKMIDLHTLSVSGHYTNKWDEPIRFDLD